MDGAAGEVATGVRGAGERVSGKPRAALGMARRLGWLALCAALVATTLLPVVVHGQDDDADHDAESHARHAEDRVGMFSTIVVTPEQPAADVACMFCTVEVDGDVRGDLAVMFSTVNVAEGRTISGDVAALFSTLRVGDGARVHGDLATAFSTAQIAPSAQIRGDRAILASGLGRLVLLGPLLILIGLVWLLAWVLRRVL